MVRVQSVPNRSIRRSIDNRQNNTSPIRSCTHSASSIACIVGIRDISTNGQPFTNLIFEIHTEVITFVVRDIQHTLFIQISGRKIVFHLLVAIGYSNLIILGLPCLVCLVKPIGAVGQSVRQRHQSDLVLQFFVL